MLDWKIYGNNKSERAEIKDKNEVVSDPWFPPTPGAAKDVGVSSVVNQAVHLFLHTAASLSYFGSLVICWVSRQNCLQSRILRCPRVPLLQIKPVLHENINNINFTSKPLPNAYLIMYTGFPPISFFLAC